MRFLVIRTSGGETPPCPEAYRSPCLRVHERTCATPEEYDRRFGAREGAWLSRGANHRLTKAGIARDEPDEAWFVDLSDLAALLAFGQKHGALILDESWMAKDTPSLEIYDDRRG